MGPADRRSSPRVWHAARRADAGNVSSQRWETFHFIATGRVLRMSRNQNFVHIRCARIVAPGRKKRLSAFTLDNEIGC
jgi:hypothetical protein